MWIADSSPPETNLYQDFWGFQRQSAQPQMPLLAEVRGNFTDYNKYMRASPIVTSRATVQEPAAERRRQLLHVAGLWELWRHLENSMQPHHTKSLDRSEVSSFVLTAVQHC